MRLRGDDRGGSLAPHTGVRHEGCCLMSLTREAAYLGDGASFRISFPCGSTR